MILRSNARNAGLVDHGQPYQATYVGCFRDGAVTAVAAHAWNGNMILQTPSQAPEQAQDAGDVCREAAARSGRPVRGLLGPWSQVVAAASVFEVDLARAAKADPEILYALDLEQLRVPEALASARVICRRATLDDLDVLARIRHDYSVETLGAKPGEALLATSRRDMERLVGARIGWVLVESEVILAFTGYNAHLPDTVQLGGVYTTPSLRRRGLARAAVAGQLLDARAEGVTRAVLFTGHDNVAAQRAYEALGFRVVGDYGLVLLG
ncbi:MAG: GNAT family N-acetyltransferase [Deltaproteobacteria bacterium]|nr:GNAT family N-acetyltransferase [Deltaproteobacteria bacterium]